MQVTEVETVSCENSSETEIKMETEDQIGATADDQNVQVSKNGNEIAGESLENESIEKKNVSDGPEVSEIESKNGDGDDDDAEPVAKCDEKSENELVTKSVDENVENAEKTDKSEDRCDVNGGESPISKPNDCESVETSESEVLPKSSHMPSLSSPDVVIPVEQVCEPSPEKYSIYSDLDMSERDVASDIVTSPDKDWLASPREERGGDSAADAPSKDNRDPPAGNRVEVYELTDDDEDSLPPTKSRRERRFNEDDDDEQPDFEEDDYNGNSSLDEERSISSDDIDADIKMDVDDYESDEQVIHSIDDSDDDMETVSPDRLKSKAKAVSQLHDDVLKFNAKHHLKEKIWKRKESNRHIYFATKRSINWYVHSLINS